jgi:hypothetical protein
MNIIKHADGVYEIEEFLSHDTQEKFLSLTEDNGWIAKDPGNITKPISNNVKITAKKVEIDIESFFSSFTQIKNITNIRRLKYGEFMHLHKDGGSHDKPEPIVFGIAIYLNDDFTGGELSYPELNLTVNPRPRSMVIHKAEYLHKVLPVISGNRYSITTFVLGDETTKFITTRGNSASS